MQRLFVTLGLCALAQAQNCTWNGTLCRTSAYQRNQEEKFCNGVPANFNSTDYLIDFAACSPITNGSNCTSQAKCELVNSSQVAAIQHCVPKRVCTYLACAYVQSAGYSNNLNCGSMSASGNTSCLEMPAPTQAIDTAVDTANQTLFDFNCTAQLTTAKPTSTPTTVQPTATPTNMPTTTPTNQPNCSECMAACSSTDTCVTAHCYYKCISTTSDKCSTWATQTCSGYMANLPQSCTYDIDCNLAANTACEDSIRNSTCGQACPSIGNVGCQQYSCFAKCALSATTPNCKTWLTTRCPTYVSAYAPGTCDIACSTSTSGAAVAVDTCFAFAAAVAVLVLIA